MTTSLKIIRYQFEDRVQEIKAVFIANFILVILMVFSDVSRIGNNVHVWACLVSGILFLLAFLFYDWRSNGWNIFLLFLYLAIGGLEYNWVGLPEPLYPIPEGYSKGMFLDLLMLLIPMLYMSLRLFLVIPVIRFFRLNNALNKIEISSSMSEITA